MSREESIRELACELGVPEVYVQSVVNDVESAKPHERNLRIGRAIARDSVTDRIIRKVFGAPKRQPRDAPKNKEKVAVQEK